MRIAAAQMDIAFEDRAANYDKARLFAENAARQNADLLVLPEMFSTGFSMNPGKTAEPADGATPAFLRTCAREARLGILGGFVLGEDGQKPMNVALAVDRNGDDLALYAKTHLFSYTSEDQHHAAGDGPHPFTFEGVRAACFVCYDLRFPELFRNVADDCHVVFVIASWPAPRQAHWDILLQARAVENQLYVVGVNRVGEGDGLAFGGGTVVVDPSGRIIERKRDVEGLLVADIDPLEVASVREAFPFLKDRRF
jgi:omega-amidase